MSAKRLAEPQKPGQNQLQGSARLFFKLTPVFQIQMSDLKFGLCLDSNFGNCPFNKFNIV